MAEEFWYRYRDRLWGPFGTPEERQKAMNRRMHTECKMYRHNTRSLYSDTHPDIESNQLPEMRAASGM